MADLAVSLSGHFRVLYKGELVTGLDGTRLQSFFAYLLLHRNSPIFRQYLAFLF
jgi:DNA-binding SARP family transcriptional activator